MMDKLMKPVALSTSSAAQTRFHHRAGVAGFTLIELMVVVVMMSILATIAYNSFGGNLRTSKTTEAQGVIRSIAAAQNQFRAEHGVYLDVSGDLDTYYPTASANVGATKTTFYQPVGASPLADRWRQLAPKVPALVQYGYATVAGLPGTLPGQAPTFGSTQTVTWPANVVEPWYAVQAIGDPAGSGQTQLLIVTSFNSKVFQEEL
jgi:prepilin-type N-terminal cleavage/methylation domain-containing protein